MSKFWYLKYYNLKEAVVLLWALFIDTLHSKIPRQVFTIKNTYEALLHKNTKFTRLKDEVIINLNDCSYGLRIFGSDFEVFNQIVVKEELKNLIGFANGLNNDHLHIVDCGANIGLSTLTFKSIFPNSKIICLEPETSNYLQLCKNIKLNNLTDIIPLQMGVWHKQTVLQPDLNFRDKSNWSFALKETPDTSINGIRVDSISNIAAKLGWSYIDILKIDIEGSEFEIFRNLSTWKSILDTVKLLSIEVHEEKGSIKEIESILLSSGFQLHSSGELLIGIRN